MKFTKRLLWFIRINIYFVYLSSMSEGKENHIIQLDGLRFFAVFSVMIAHWAQWHLSNKLLKELPFVHGVTLFFVLSGFLITTILLTNKEHYLKQGKGFSKLIKNFYFRRILRIFPIYYLLLLVLFIFNYQNTRELIGWLSTYTINIYQSITNVYVGNFNHFWSLAVEEQFYLFWPFLILFIPNKHLLKILVLIIALSILSKAYTYGFTQNWMAISYFTSNCMYALGFGALLAFLKTYHFTFLKKFIAFKWFLIVAFTYLFSLFIQISFSLSWWKYVVDDVLFSIVACQVILIASENGFKGIFKELLEHPFIVLCGKISYGMYLYHLFIPTKIFESLNGLASLILLFILTFIVSYLSWKFIEQPINQLKQKFPYFSN